MLPNKYNVCSKYTFVSLAEKNTNNHNVANSKIEHIRNLTMNATEMDRNDD